MAKVRNRRPGRRKERGERVNRLNRRALLSKVAAGLALTAAGSATALSLNIDDKGDKGDKGSVKIKGDKTLGELSDGSLSYDPAKFTVTCTEGKIEVKCKK